MTVWHSKTAAQVLAELRTDPSTGLTNQEAARRLGEFGPNELIEKHGRGVGRILWEQFSSALVVMLLVAAIISQLLGETTDTLVIAAIVVLNAILGFVQDYRAERTLAALKKLSVPSVRVRRDGQLCELSSRELVPGDIIAVEAGNQIPADCRLLEALNLKVEEAALTGESEAVLKSTASLSDQQLSVGDRINMLYMGTIVTYGHGTGIVTSTGMLTELGHIAQSLGGVRPESTPLQKRLAQLGASLAVVALAIVGVVFLLGIMQGEEPRLMLMTALSLAVAVVPEGLPAVATVALALGARRLYQRNALIRMLPAVETLGSVTVICSDKTGTLTENRMTVTVLDVAGDRLDLVDGRLTAPAIADSSPHPRLSRADLEHDVPREKMVNPSAANNSAMALLLTGATLCNDAELQFDAAAGAYRAVGDPTEAALVVAAAQLGFERSELMSGLPRVAELPFDSERKCMTTVHRISGSVQSAELQTEWSATAKQAVDGKDSIAAKGAAEAIRQLLSAFNCQQVAFTKGAVDRVLQASRQVWVKGERQELTPEWQQRIAHANASLAGRGMRVLALAFRPVCSLPVPATGELGSAEPMLTSETPVVSIDELTDELERELIFVGLIGMLDPPRAEAAAAVSRCRSAGIRPVMITGDHPLTAQYIAAQLDISHNGAVMTGADLETISEADLAERVKDTSVYARVSPKHKLRLVQALQAGGQVVAMTGDGVNDAPALKQAHIGVAMGISGTDVSKEASQMVLLDDNFATIVGAVEQGRIVYDNIRKFVKYTLTSNAGEVWVMVLGPLLGLPLPLLPLQILWINLVTDGLPGLALAAEPAERNVMRRQPYPPDQHIFAAGMGRDIAWIGLLMGCVSLALGYVYWWRGADERLWRTLVFTVLTAAQMGNALAISMTHDSILRFGVRNRGLLAAVLLTLGLQLLVIYWPPLQAVFQTSPLSWGELLACLLVSSIVFWVIELRKLLFPVETAEVDRTAAA